MNFFPVPSLKNIALARSAAVIWNLEDVRRIPAVSSYFNSYHGVHHITKEAWVEVEKGVMRKMARIQLPQVLKKELVSFIEILGWQMLQEIHNHFVQTGQNEPFDKFFWTQRGTIDKIKTARYLLRNSDISYESRFVIACVYCFEDEVYSLWEHVKENFQSDVVIIENLAPLVVYWLHHLEGRYYQLMDSMQCDCFKAFDKRFSPSAHAFHYASVIGNEVAAQYFFERVEPHEVGRILVGTALSVAHALKSSHQGVNYNKQSGTMCSLLSKMDREHQMQVFAHHPFEVLEFLLEWPWQGLFIEAAKNVWPFLSMEKHMRTFEFIAKRKISANAKSYDYLGLLRAFWEESPSLNKNYVINQFALQGFVLDPSHSSVVEEIVKIILQK